MSGIEDPNTIDLVTKTSDGTYKVIMIETRPWDPSEDRLSQLSLKVHNYVAFILDGQMHQFYPESKGEPVIIQLDCAETPDPETSVFIDDLNQRLAKYDLQIEVHLVPAE
jgi:hypothetical protein